MAARTLQVTTPTITGASVASISSNMVSADTVVISVTTAQSSLGFDSLVIRADNLNSETSVILTLGVGTEFSDIGIGTTTVAIATDESVIIGGQLFESSRFQTSGGTFIMTAAGSGPTSIEAYQRPKALE